MKKINLCSLWFLLIIFFVLITNASVNAEDQKDDKTSYLVIGSGFEYLSYSEYEPETGTSSDTSLYNAVTKFDGVLSLSHVFIGIKGVLPVFLGKEKEEWERFGRIYQTNTLECAWTRIDGYVGYRLYDWLNPYLGFRWAKSRHERSNFFLSESVSGKAIETNKAVFAAAGFKGTLKSPPRWQFQYSIECFIPVYSHTENSALSGWKASGNDGYSIGARAGVKYKYSPSLSLYYELAGERAYWDGSGWIDYPGGSAKWPENETISINSILGIAFSF